MLNLRVACSVDMPAGSDVQGETVEGCAKPQLMLLRNITGLHLCAAGWALSASVVSALVGHRLCAQCTRHSCTVASTPAGMCMTPVQDLLLTVLSCLPACRRLPAWPPDHADGHVWGWQDHTHGLPSWYAPHLCCMCWLLLLRSSWEHTLSASCCSCTVS